MVCVDMYVWGRGDTPVCSGDILTLCDEARYEISLVSDSVRRGGNIITQPLTYKNTMKKLINLVI